MKKNFGVALALILVPVFAFAGGGSSSDSTFYKKLERYLDGGTFPLNEVTGVADSRYQLLTSQQAGIYTVEVTYAVNSKTDEVIAALKLNPNSAEFARLKKDDQGRPIVFSISHSEYVAGTETEMQALAQRKFAPFEKSKLGQIWVWTKRELMAFDVQKGFNASSCDIHVSHSIALGVATDEYQVLRGSRPLIASQTVSRAGPCSTQEALIQTLLNAP
jgi:hypothetical protein